MQTMNLHALCGGCIGVSGSVCMCMCIYSFGVNGFGGSMCVYASVCVHGASKQLRKQGNGQEIEKEIKE